MKNLKKFENYEEIMKRKQMENDWQEYDELKPSVIKFIEDKFNEDYVNQQIEENMYNYLDDGWEDEYDSEYDWYRDYGRGEAEADIRMEIEKEVLDEFHLTYEKYEEITGEDLWDTIYEIFPQLDAG